MADFREHLSEDLKTAMRSRAEVARETIRMLNAALKNAQIAAMRPLSEDEAQAVLVTQIKQRRDSIDQFRQAGREDLATREEAELEILSQYLPAAPSAEEIESALQEAIATLGATGPQDMAKVMRAVLERYPGQIDGKQLAPLVRSALAGKG